ncbi:MAG: hypothetical protein GY899_07430 [Verrucomicrobiaceae bacterium]|nr:hypothetical protein [Verrucomicrobiaceae bacterium]
MKWFIFLIVIGGLVFAGLRFKEEIVRFVSEMGSDKPIPGKSTGNDPVAQPEPETPPEGNNRPDPPAEVADPIALKYPMPDFKPLEEYVDNWQKVPASAFPREVTLKAKASFIIGDNVGSTTRPTGSKNTALSISNGQLVITPHKSSILRAKVAIEDTNYKEVLNGEYEKYKERKRKLVRAQRERARAIAASEERQTLPQTSEPVTSVTVATASKLPKTVLNEYENKIGKMPERDGRGRVALMVKSIEQGDVTEINLNEISHWGPVRYELVDRQPYWTGTVNYKTNSLFGTFDTEAMALIRNDKVEAWVYTGSLEEVP